jgi:UPF0716 protein FxsA
MWPIVAILALPLIEIALFIVVGGAIGVWPTLGLVVGAGVGGVAVIRMQGARALDRTRRAFDRHADPSAEVLGGALSVLAGILLIAPGFLTDIVAIALLLPPVRAAAIAGVRSGMTHPGFPGRDGPGTPASQVIIDGTWEEVPPQGPQGPAGTSGWTRH